MTTASRQVAWFEVYSFVASLLAMLPPWPAAGTPEWCDLDDDDPRKIAAVLDDGVHWALRIDTEQERRSEVAHILSAAGVEAGDWKALHRQVIQGSGARIPRKAAS